MQAEAKIVILCPAVYFIFREVSKRYVWLKLEVTLKTITHTRESWNFSLQAYGHPTTCLSFLFTNQALE